MEIAGDKTLGGEHTMEHTDNVLQNCTLETCVLLINVSSPMNLIKNQIQTIICFNRYVSFKEEMIKWVWMRTSERSTRESLRNTLNSTVPQPTLPLPGPKAAITFHSEPLQQQGRTFCQDWLRRLKC